MPGMDDRLEKSTDASRVGKAVELLIASSCILASDAKLNVSTSVVDDEGVDLVFHRRGGTATLAVQVKARTYGSSRVARGSFLADVRTQTFRPHPDLYMLFVTANTTDATFGPVWLVPSPVFKERALKTGKGKLRFTASLKPSSKDKWREFRLERAELAARILEILSPQL